MGSYAFSIELKVRFAETDAQGLAHHAAYLVWLEVARVEYLAAFAGGYPALRERGIEAITREVHLSYLDPARFDDRLTLHARCAEVRGARFRFKYRIDRGGDAVAEGWTAHACVDAQTLRPTRVPPWLVTALEAAESNA